MKILNLEEFRKLPSGVIYSKYEPCIFEGLMIKDDTLESDFYFTDLLGNIECRNEEQFINNCSRAEVKMSVGFDFNVIERDGLFEKDQLFAVYEKFDVSEFINKLKESLEKYPEIII